ncbi:hypothetical protein ACH4OW_33925 [Streptomyces sp. NPDC017056]|uniref:hypothetical protein n=1 Tax=Streptomyces sp. NPDC017056 TaxID=3364973 RepID=UPI003798714F
MLARLGEAEAEALRNPENARGVVREALHSVGFLVEESRIPHGELQAVYVHKFLARGLSVQVQGAALQGATCQTVFDRLADLGDSAPGGPALSCVTLALTDGPWDTNLQQAVERFACRANSVRLRASVKVSGEISAGPALRPVDVVTLDLADPGSGVCARDRFSRIASLFNGAARFNLRPHVPFTPEWGEFIEAAAAEYELRLLHHYGPGALSSAERLHWRVAAERSGMPTENVITSDQERPFACPASDPYAFVISHGDILSKCASDPLGSVVGRLAEAGIDLDEPEQARWSTAGWFAAGDSRCGACALTPKCFGEVCPKASLDQEPPLCPVEDQASVPLELEPCQAAGLDDDGRQPAWFPACGS